MTRKAIIATGAVGWVTKGVDWLQAARMILSKHIMDKHLDFMVG
jgi:hypothetical protein